MKELTYPPKRIAVTWHPQLPKAKKEAEEIVKCLKEYDLDLIQSFSLNDQTFRDIVKKDSYDLVITLGGDGTMIRTSKLCAPMGIPVLGINMGSFGFLIETQQDQWREKIPALLKGEGKIEERMMLHAEHMVNGVSVNSWEVLNDAIVARGSTLRPIRMNVKIAGSLLTDYVADGLIVSSATGSTAYSMSVGGPVL